MDAGQARPIDRLLAGHVSPRLARRGRRLLALLTVALLLAACAGSSSILSTVGNSVGTGAAEPAGPAGVPEQAAASAAASAASEDYRAASGKGTTGTLVLGQTSDALIVKTGNLTLQVDDLDKALAGANDAIRRLGGYVSGSSRSNDGEQARAEVTYRIPAARWDDALTALHGLARKVIGEQTNAVEVTGQVLDLGARIDNLQATEKALQAIMARATKIQDVLDVQQQLTDVRGQIEQLQTQKQHLEDQAAMSSLTVDFGLPVVAVTAATRSWDPGAELDRAVAQLVEVGQALATGLIWFAIVWLPVLLLVGLVALVAWLVARRLGFRRGGQTRPPLPATPEA
ncbi:MAG TPA: DUF4349 domain-containing protein [Candidatus Limnocylindrales bacterium]